MDELYCHGNAISINLEVIDNNMLGDDYSHKAKIMKERKIYDEKKPLRKKRRN
jgi:hypothetical protein